MKSKTKSTTHIKINSSKKGFKRLAIHSLSLRDFRKIVKEASLTRPQ